MPRDGYDGFWVIFEVKKKIQVSIVLKKGECGLMAELDKEPSSNHQ